MPCGNPYCHECLKEPFVRACDDEELFPPRCCSKPIPLRHVEIFLTETELLYYCEKVEEYNSDQRIYCADNSCAAFILPALIIGDRATCKVCEKPSCKICGKAWHEDEDCPEDSELEQTLAYAAKMGWQRCRNCHALVERVHGCEQMSNWDGPFYIYSADNPIACWCHAQWCYRCAAPWKTCECGD